MIIKGERIPIYPPAESGIDHFRRPCQRLFTSGKEIQIKLGVILYFPQDIPVDGIIGNFPPKAPPTRHTSGEIIFVKANGNVAFRRDKDSWLEFFKKPPCARIFLRKIAHPLWIVQERLEKIRHWL